MTEDYAFVQADGSEVRGGPKLQKAWAGYVDLIPGSCSWQRPGISYRPSLNSPGLPGLQVRGKRREIPQQHRPHLIARATDVVRIQELLNLPKV